MTVLAYRREAGRRRVRLILLGGMVLSLLLSGAWWMSRAGAPAGGGTFSYHALQRGPIRLVVRKDGELQAIRNLDVLCQVAGQSTIRSLVAEGSIVKKDDVVCELDSSELQRKLASATLDVRRAESDYTAAQEQRRIQESKNVADLEAAEVELKLARIDLRAYSEGELPQRLNAARREVEMAETKLRKAEQDMLQTRDLHARGFVTASEVQTGMNDLIVARNDFEKKSADLRVLSEYTSEKELADKRNKVAQAEKKLARTQSENAANLSQKAADEQAKEQLLKIRRDEEQFLQKQIALCTIRAPGDGLVIYGSSVRDYWYNDTPMQPGAKVMETQLLVRIPDTSAMKAKALIPEAHALKLKVDEANPFRAAVSIVGQKDPIPGRVTSVAMLSDSSQRWWNPGLKEYAVEVTLDTTPANIKPGTSTQVEILLQEKPDVAAAPLACLYASGPQQYVFVREAAGPRPQPVTLGLINDSHAEIVDGVNAGAELVVLEVGQGQRLLEQAGLATPSGAPSSSVQ